VPVWSSSGISQAHYTPRLLEAGSGGEDVQDDLGEVVKYQGTLETDDMTQTDPFLALAVEVKADPQWWRDSVSAGAARKGLAQADLAEMLDFGRQAIDLVLEDSEPDPRRQAVYEEIARSSVMLMLGLAVAGQPVERAGEPVSP
jgi:hypothetical protein